MVRRWVLVLVLLLFQASVSFAAPVVANFDDLTGSGAVGSNYQGIDWSAGAWQFYDSTQSPYNPSSGATRIYSDNTFTSPNSFSFLTASIFDGAYVNGNSTAGPVSFTLRLAGVVVATSTSYTPDDSGVGMFLASGYSGLVDTVEVNGQGGYYILDDVSYQTASSVPEIDAASGSLPIAILACLLLLVLDRKKALSR